MPTFASLADALTALPLGAEAIADHLAELDVRGSCNEPARCAIAEYLTAVVEIPAGLAIQVSNHAASIRRPGGLSVPAVERIWFHDLDRYDIGEFVANFDRGQYPALVGGKAATVAA